MDGGSTRASRPVGAASPARLRLAVALVVLVVGGGTLGYWLLGLRPLDALYQTVTTISTVGFREVDEFGDAEQWFTIVVIFCGVGTVLYTLSLGVQMMVEGRLTEYVGRRRMDRRIASLDGHVVVCGWGRVGRAVAADLRDHGREVVIVDIDRERVTDIAFPTVVDDATLDDTLRTAGIERAYALVAALAGDAQNLFVTLSGRALNPSLFIVARARQEDSISKLSQAGADRVVNPQELGAARMASFIVQPNVAEFVDVVMHERSMEFRMREVEVPAGSSLAHQSLRVGPAPRAGERARPRPPPRRRDVRRQPRSRHGARTGQRADRRRHHRRTGSARAGARLTGRADVRIRLMDAVADRPPPWLLAAKALLAALLVVGAVFPDVGGFAGKGMAYRLPLFLAPALVVPIRWLRRRGPYPVGLDVALTVPFLLDTAANAVGLYDHFARTDDALHFVNWLVLVGGVTATLATHAGAAPRWLLWLGGTGFGAMAIVGWEAAEYAVMRSGVGGLDLTYGDTVADLLLSTTGGALGAALVARHLTAPAGGGG